MNISQQEVEKIAIDHYGAVPPMIKQMYQVSPGVALHYIVGVTALTASKHSYIEQQAIQLHISHLNGCESCMKGHSYLLKNAGMSEEDIMAIRHGLKTAQSKINRLLDITSLVFTGGRGGFEAVVERLEQLESTKEEVYQIISLLASKTISNYINNYSLASKKVVKF